MVETYFFFPLSSVCVHGVWVRFSAYTEKDRGGWAWGWVRVVGSSHFFIFFWNACMVVYGFAWFDRVDSFGREK